MAAKLSIVPMQSLMHLYTSELQVDLQHQPSLQIAAVFFINYSINTLCIIVASAFLTNCSITILLHNAASVFFTNCSIVILFYNATSIFFTHCGFSVLGKLLNQHALQTSASAFFINCLKLPCVPSSSRLRY